MTLTADNFAPGRPSETFGPASDLFGRFLWALFAKNRVLYDQYISKGANQRRAAADVTPNCRSLHVMCRSVTSKNRASASGVTYTPPSGLRKFV